MLFEAENAHAGTRLDHHLSGVLPQFSRSRIQDWIKAGRVKVDGKSAKPSYVLRGGERIEVEPAELRPLRAVPEAIPLRILYSDSDLVVIDKPAGMVVHAGAGRHSGTLVNALLHEFKELSSTGGDERPGIVHRLDRDTSGVLVVARTDAAHRALAEQFAGRTVEKVYLALVQGQVRQEHGHIRAKIARDPVRRTRMAIRLDGGRESHTEYRVLRRFARYTLLELTLHTGRTHQIRVHLSSAGHPVAGDTLYGAARARFGRFFLHAQRLSFDHPGGSGRVTFESPLPAELEEWLSEVSPQ